MFFMHPPVKVDSQHAAPCDNAMSSKSHAHNPGPNLRTSFGEAVWVPRWPFDGQNLVLIVTSTRRFARMTSLARVLRNHRESRFYHALMLYPFRPKSGPEYVNFPGVMGLMAHPAGPDASARMV